MFLGTKSKVEPLWYSLLARKAHLSRMGNLQCSGIHSPMRFNTPDCFQDKRIWKRCVVFVATVCQEKPELNTLYTTDLYFYQTVLSSREGESLETISYLYCFTKASRDWRSSETSFSKKTLHSSSRCWCTWTNHVQSSVATEMQSVSRRRQHNSSAYTWFVIQGYFVS